MSSPTLIGSATNWVTLVSGIGHWVGLRNDGSLWGWGDNSAGQLGDGTGRPSAEPVRIGAGARRLAVGAFHYESVGLQADGSLWLWGQEDCHWVNAACFSRTGLRYSGMLKANATIAVVAPASVSRREALERGMALLRAWGYTVVEGDHVRDRHLFNAGTADARSADLVWALSDPAIDAVWLARGGYGCVHCLPALRQRPFDDRPVVGCSDATALFCALSPTGHTGLIHGPVLETLATRVDEASRLRLRGLLSGAPMDPICGQHLCGPRVAVSGPLVGGNLCVLASLAGTPWALRAAGAILVLEDVAEAAYRIDRMITQLRWSGAFDGVVGIALGDFISCRPPVDADFTLDDVLAEALIPLGVPVVKGLPMGHGPCNLAWRHGEIARLRDASLVFGEAPATASPKPEPNSNGPL